ncbi:TPA: site-specific integrase [Pseudomonas aeruginosa]|uniref:site-specific integrase n=1 Tax=Pseudomonas aeruginosa TaxID=287 RepID=UPI001920C82E|nr:site-specific integrase [Pseudomonas aeruginosa]MBX6038547.1 site-specific integrase [Pseudomonas aeruginosa]MBX6566136.1 site-specific integrase [Pseudomonas aeruginosa]MBX6647863.1 site-specific integrase [Pseudomonas aeruginosa]MBX6802551.1 site-specific integrase [Pseudomonas aeruginosa]MBX6809047.1 site-specific integrase [Pseudomonas aeruginosa]
MARLEIILLTRHKLAVIAEKIQLSAMATGSTERLPQIFWENSRPWAEANLWLYERVSEGQVTEDTIHSNAVALHAYAQWLENTATSWSDFPQRKADRCLVKYRGSLKERMRKGEISTSVASNRIRVVISFYRWLNANKLISTDWPMWTERLVGVRIQNSFGLDRTLLVNSTDLAISNRRSNTDKLEDGLLPVSPAFRDEILGVAREHSSEELELMLSLSFFTGMRLGTICDLKLETIENASPDPATPNLYRLEVGPEATPSVHTKGGVTGFVWILKGQLETIKDYMYSLRRINRESLAEEANKNLVFLTRFGNPYTRNSNRSSVINVEMYSLRKAAVAKGIKVHEFRFHQARATFATELTRALIESHGKVNILEIVKSAMLHKHESTTLKYIKFVEKSPVKAEAANAFTRAFLGIKEMELRNV